MKNLFTIIVLFLAFSSCQKKTEPVRTNILWITCEDISPTLSFYGDSTAQTPNLDRLGSQSLIYNNAYAPVGVCAPSRSAIITGMYPISIGTQHMRTGKDVMSWGQRTYSGESNAVDIDGSPVPHYSAVIPAEVKCFTEYLRANDYFCTNNQKTDYQFAAPVTAWDENSNKAHWRNRPEGKSFFSVFNLGVTHESRIWRHSDLPLTVNPDSVPLPPYYPDNAQVRLDVARNYSNIELLDRQVGEILGQLEEDGLTDSTIIFFFSDHGGPLPRGKREHYDSGLKVPFLVRLPGQKPGEIDELISFVDLAPTLLSLANVPVPGYMQGRAFLGSKATSERREYVYGSGDRFDEFADRIRVVRDEQYLYVRNYHPELAAYKDVAYRKNIPMMDTLLELHAAGKLNAQQDYWFRTTKTDEELYDCLSDPYNLYNLIDEPALSDKKEELSLALDTFMEEVGDMAAVPEREMFEAMWPGGEQPITSAPKAVVANEELQLSCETLGASIAYILNPANKNPDNNAGWQLYSKPVEVNTKDVICYKAHRIGFKESNINWFTVK